MTVPRKKRILRSLQIDEVSGVDRAAQVPAQALLRKRYEDEEEMGPDGKKRKKPKAEKGYGPEFDRPMLTTEVDGHQHVLDDCGQGGETSWAKSEGEEHGHSHPWVRMLDGSIVVGAAEGHTHDLIPTSTIVVEATRSAGGAGGGQTQGEHPMTKQDPEAAKGTEIPEAVQKSIADLTARAERAEAIMKLNADERAVFDSLQGDAQGQFLSKSADQRAEAIREAKDADRVVYKALNGDVFRASDDPRLAKMAREADEERERTRKALEQADMARLEKRADAELAHCPGTVAVRAKILKALEGVEDAGEFLKAADAALAKSFKPSGTTGTTASGEELSKAEDRLEVLAKAHQATNPGLTIEAATAAVLETPEGSKLYAEMSA